MRGGECNIKAKSVDPPAVQVEINTINKEKVDGLLWAPQENASVPGIHSQPCTPSYLPSCFFFCSVVKMQNAQGLYFIQDSRKTLRTFKLTCSPCGMYMPCCWAPTQLRQLQQSQQHCQLMQPNQCYSTLGPAKGQSCQSQIGH